ncbi:MAG: hypothetical protein DME92_03415, partial [Verrucomicrobia bacterium]
TQLNELLIWQSLEAASQYIFCNFPTRFGVVRKKWVRRAQAHPFPMTIAPQTVKEEHVKCYSNDREADNNT